MPDSYDAWRKRAPKLAAMTYDELIARNMILVGGPATVAKQLRKLRSELDIAILTCVFHLGGLAHDKVARSMKLFAEKVLPTLELASAA